MKNNVEWGWLSLCVLGSSQCVAKATQKSKQNHVWVLVPLTLFVSVSIIIISNLKLALGISFKVNKTKRNGNKHTRMIQHTVG